MGSILDIFDPNAAAKSQQAGVQSNINTAANQEQNQTNAALAALQGILKTPDPAAKVTTPTIGSNYTGFDPGRPMQITQDASGGTLNAGGTGGVGGSVGGAASGTAAPAAAAAKPAAAGTNRYSPQGASGPGGANWGGLKWTPMTTAQGTTGYTAAGPGGKTYYTGSDGKLYLDQNAGEVQPNDVGSNLVGNRNTYFGVPDQAPAAPAAQKKVTLPVAAGGGGLKTMAK